jgi:hypothetical protein
MEMQTFKLFELLLIVGVVGYFFLRQRRSLEQLKQEREAKQQEAGASDDGAGSDRTS